jgi:hypothetical protein
MTAAAAGASRASGTAGFALLFVTLHGVNDPGDYSQNHKSHQQCANIGRKPSEHFHYLLGQLMPWL